MRKLTVLLGLALLLGGAAEAAIIGHHEVDQVAGLPQTVLDGVGQQRWLFAHASVGGNIIGGMNGLHDEDPVRYQLGFATAGNGSAILPPPAVTTPGTVYDGSRGNPGWAAKFAMFDDAVRDLGWRYPLVDAVMDKLCYIDESADVAVYLASMTALENDHPGTAMVYTTMPLQSGSGMNWANILASNYNQAVRQHCATGGRLLLDIADIESHDPAGNAITFTSDGQTYERLYSGYTSDGRHLNALGARRVALGWYAAAAVLALPTVAVAESAGLPRAQIASVAPNPFNPATTIRFRLARAGHAELAVFDARGRLVDGLVDAQTEAGEHAVTWRGCDDAGRAVGAGVYLVRLSAGDDRCTRRITLAR